jgi:hypothetical protein
MAFAMGYCMLLYAARSAGSIYVTNHCDRRLVVSGPAVRGSRHNPILLLVLALRVLVSRWRRGGKVAPSSSFDPHRSVWAA